MLLAKPYVSALGISEKKSRSAKIEWNISNFEHFNESRHQIKCSLKDPKLEKEIICAKPEPKNNHALTGLQPNTHYEFIVNLITNKTDNRTSIPFTTLGESK